MSQGDQPKSFELFSAIPFFHDKSNESDQIDVRLGSAMGALSAVTHAEGEVLLLFPAGYLRTETAEERATIVEALAMEARRHRVHLVFGIDVASRKEQAALSNPIESAYLYRHDRNHLVEFARIDSDRANSKDVLPGERQFEIGPLTISLLFAGEIFFSTIRRRLAESRPDLTIVLSPSGITRRWGPALEALDRVAPILTLPRSATPRRGREAPPPRGWRKELHGATANLLLYRWSPEPD
jgi:hypothetical protein